MGHEISPVYHTNKYTADSACEHCQGIIRHETWCITKNANVLYAFDILIHIENMTEQDKIILHALGVIWTVLTTPQLCDGSCPK